MSTVDSSYTITVCEFPGSNPDLYAANATLPIKLKEHIKHPNNK